MKNKKMFFLKTLRALGILMGVGGAIIGIGNEKLSMENFYISIKIARLLIAGGIITILLSSVFIHFEKYKPPKLLYPLKKSK